MAARITNKSGGRYYPWTKEGMTERFWSVTTILDLGIPKPALINWAAKVVAQFSVGNYDLLGEMVARIGTTNFFGAVITEEAVAKWLAMQRYEARETAADIGSHVHEAIEAYTLGKPYPGVPKAAAAHYESFLRLLDGQRPIFLATEASVYNRTRKYAGTLDGIAVWPNLAAHLADNGREIESFYPKHCPVCLVPAVPGSTTFTHGPMCKDGEPPAPKDYEWYHPDGPVLIDDVKTGKALYPEVGLQLAAYSRAEFMGGPEGSELPLPGIDGALGILLRPGWSELVPVDIGEAVFRHFLYAYETARWAEEVSKSVLGKPMAIYEVVPGPENPERLRAQIADLEERVKAAEAELAAPPPLFLEATSGRGENPPRHAVGDPPTPHPSGQQFAALCGSRVAQPAGVPFVPGGRNVCPDCTKEAAVFAEQEKARLDEEEAQEAAAAEPVVIDKPCPECGCQCEPVEQAPPKKRPLWRCTGETCLGNDKGDGQWVSWHTQPWKIGGQVGPPRVPGPGQESMNVSEEAAV